MQTQTRFRPIGKITRKVTVLMAILFVFAVCQMYPRGEEKGSGKSFLWQVQSDKGKSYILGSIHQLKKEYYPLKENIEKAFAESGVLVVEADISSEEALKQALALMKKGMYQGEDTLKKNISPETFQKTEKKLKELGMDIGGFEKSKPWFVAVTIVATELMKMGFDPNYGIDKYFLGKASGKKEVLELEGLEFQVNLFDSFSPEESEKFLFYTIEESTTVNKELDKMVAAWVDGEVEKLEELVTQNVQKYPELKNLYRKLIEDRNHKMAEKIAAYLDTDKIHFVVAGAAHMVGKEGIIQLLKDRGFRVKQL